MNKNIVVTLLIVLISPLSIFVQANPAIEAFEEGNNQLAKTLFEKNKDSAESKLYLGRLAMREGELDDAEELIKEALEMKPNDSNYHYWFASISGMQAGNASIFSAPGYASDSKEHFIKAVELDPNNIQALTGLIGFYTQAPSIVGGSTEKAQQLSVKLLKLDKKEGLSAQINLHRKEGETEKEFEKVEELATAYPNSSEVLLRAGFAYQGAKKYETSYEYFIKASSIKESDLDESLNKKEIKGEKLAAMNALYQVGRNAVLGDIKVDEGIIALESYLKLTPNKSQPSHNWAKVRLAALYLEKGDKNKAKELALAAKKDKSDGGPRKLATKLLRKIKKSK